MVSVVFGIPHLACVWKHWSMTIILRLVSWSFLPMGNTFSLPHWTTLWSYGIIPRANHWNCTLDTRMRSTACSPTSRSRARSGSSADRKITVFIYGIYKPKRSCRNSKDTRTWWCAVHVIRKRISSPVEHWKMIKQSNYGEVTSNGKNLCSFSFCFIVSVCRYLVVFFFFLFFFSINWECMLYDVVIVIYWT